MQHPNLAHPIAKLAAHLAYNIALEEESFEFTATHYDDADECIARKIRKSQRLGTVIDLGEHLTEAEILSGFECHAADLDHEVCLVAWSHPSRPGRYRFVTAERGTTGSVSVPEDRFIASIAQHIGTRKVRVLVLHNHPTNVLTMTTSAVYGDTPGPSSADREVLRQWQRLRAFNIQTTFWLLEDMQWRRITGPSLERLLAALRFKF